MTLPIKLILVFSIFVNFALGFLFLNLMSDYQILEQKHFALQNDFIEISKKLKSTEASQFITTESPNIYDENINLIIGICGTVIVVISIIVAFKGNPIPDLNLATSQTAPNADQIAETVIAKLNVDLSTIMSKQTELANASIDATERIAKICIKNHNDWVSIQKSQNDHLLSMYNSLASALNHLLGSGGQ